MPDSWDRLIVGSRGSAAAGWGEQVAAQAEQEDPDAGEDRAEQEHRRGEEAAGDQGHLQGGAEQQSGAAAATTRSPARAGWR